MKVLSGSREKVVARKGNYKILEIIDFRGKRAFYLMTKGGVLLRQFSRFDQADDALLKMTKNPGINGKSKERLLCPVCGKKFDDYLAATRHWGKYHIDIGPIAPYPRTWTLEGARFLRRGYNPGTSWHVDRKLFNYKLADKAKTKKERELYLARAGEQEFSAYTSRRLGIPNPTKKKFPLLGLGFIAGIGYLIWRANK